jgi:Ca2+-binding RTX toxin-like protein
LVGSSGADTLQAERGDDLIVSADVESATEALNVNFGMTDQGAAELAALKSKLDTRFDGDAVYEAVRNPTLLDRVGSALSEAGTSNADDVVFAGSGNDTIVADLSDTVTGGDGLDSISIISGGAGEAVTVKDFTPGEDTINVYVPAGTNPAVSFIDGATPADGLSVVVAGDTVAVLKGMIKANVPAGAIVVTVVTA